MNRLSDSIVLFGYLACVIAFGCWFARRSQTSGQFMAAGGRLPGWAVGLSLFGTYLSSNTFIGNPGKAFGGNWNAYVFSLSIPIGAWIAAKWFVPFYRRSGEISAYHHLEARFGSWARLYTVACYLLTQVTRAGTIMLGVSIGMHAVTGWDVQTTIIATGILVTLYTLIGGIEAVIWTDVVQSIVLTVGALLVVALLLFGDPGGAALLESAQTAEGGNKFSLGSFSLDFTSSTFWVVFLFGVFINMTNFGIDQNYIQRYHTASSEKAAKRSLWLGALVYLPVSALFFLIGTLLFGFYEARPEDFAAIQELASGAGEGDKVNNYALPHFMANHLPLGMGGLLVAALFAAAMSTVDSSLNSSATITLRDIFRGIARSDSELAQMRVLRGATIFWGILGTIVAILLSHDERDLLQIWWDLSGVLAGAMLGLFLLGFATKRTGNIAALCGVTGGLAIILWIALSGKAWMPEMLRSPLHKMMAVSIGTTAIFTIGVLASRLFPRKTSSRPKD